MMDPQQMRALGRVVPLALALLALVAGDALASLFPADAFAVLAAGSTVGTTANVEGNVNEAMKVLFEDPISDNVVEDSELLDLFEKDMNVSTDQTTGGRYIELAHYFNLPAGVGARRLEGDYIPVPQGPTIRNSRIFLKKVEGVVQMSGDVMRRVKQGSGAFLNWSDRALPDLVRRVVNEHDRMLVGFGAGIKARVNVGADPVSTTIPIDRAYGVDGLNAAHLLFLENETVVFSDDPAGGTLREAGSGQAAKVTDVSPDGILTVDRVPDGVADGDYIFLGDASGASTQDEQGEDREIMGLLGMIDDGEILEGFQGLQRSDYRPWRANAFDGSAEPWNGEVSEELLVFADEETAVNGGGTVSHLVMSRTQARKYWQSMKGDRVLNDPRSYTGGKRGLHIDLMDRTVELKVSRKVPPSLVFGVQADTLKRWQNTGWEWDDTTGSIWNRVTDGVGRKDAFYAVGHMVLQTGCIAPRKNFVIRGLNAVG